MGTLTGAADGPAAAVRTLPERQRACVVLTYLEDMTEREIADALDCSSEP